MILNCPVTADDADRANTIYGPSIATLKGKTTRTKSKPVVTDYVYVPTAVLDSNKTLPCQLTSFLSTASLFMQQLVVTSILPLWKPSQFGSSLSLLNQLNIC